MKPRRKHVDKGAPDLPEGKLGVQLFLGSGLIAFGLWTAANLEMVLGMSSKEYYLSFTFALLSILAGGWIWSRIAKEVSENF